MKSSYLSKQDKPWQIFIYVLEEQVPNPFKQSGQKPYKVGQYKKEFGASFPCFDLILCYLQQK